MGHPSLKACALAAAVLAVVPRLSQAALTFYVDPGSPWPAGWYNAAVTDMQTVVNMYNAYGDFTTNNGGSIYVYYDAGIPTEQAGYGGWGGSIGVGGTYPNVRVLLHESSHWLGTGTYSAWWGGPSATTLIQQTDGLGSVLNGDSQHYWPYGENYDSESSPINDLRHVAMVYALRQDFGLAPAGNPTAWAATTVNLTSSDPVGTSGFNYTSTWSDNTFAHPNANYSTGNFTLRTPTGTPGWTFAGNSLTVNNTNGINGGLLYKGSGTTGVVTINNLTLNGGYVRHASSSADLFQLAGHITLVNTSTIDAAQGNISISAPISGTGSLTKAGVFTLTLSANNSYTGATTINGGTLRLAAVAPVASYSFANVSGNTVVNDGTGGAAMNGTFNINGGSGSIFTTGGPRPGLGVLNLNGSGSTVDINSGITDLGGNGTWSVSAWIKTTQAGATLFNKGNGNGWNSGYSTFYLGDGTNDGSGGLPDAVRWGGGWAAGNKTVNDGQWHLLTYTDAAGTKSVYVDGALTSLAQNQFFNPDTGSMVRIGFAPTNVDGEVTTNGQLSGIKFFTSALSAAQVQQLYTNSRTTNVLPTTSDVTIGAATLDVNGTLQTIGSLNGTASSLITLGNGTLTINSPATTTYAGNINGAGGSLAIAGGGSLTFSGNNSYTGGTTINAGSTLIIAGASALPSGKPVANNGKLLVNAGATIGQLSGNGALTIGTAGTPATLHLSANAPGSIVAALTLNTGSQLDLANSALVVQSADAATKATALDTLTGLVNAARNNGAWNTPGITSAFVAGNASQFGIAVADNALLHFSTFAGQSVNDNSILIAPELLGDTNLDNKIDLTDLSTVLNHFGTATAAWTDGNFDGASTINLTDLSYVLNHFGTSNPNPFASSASTAAPAISTAAPEPATAATLAIAALLLAKRRRS
ncbi:MAG: beta strand repeat-containing protein [Phycisphaerae bacterium]